LLADAWHGTLDRLHTDDIDAEGNLPGIIVVGAVAALAGIIAAEDTRDVPRTSVSLG